MTAFHITASQCPGLTVMAHGPRVSGSILRRAFRGVRDRTICVHQLHIFQLQCFMNPSCGGWLPQVMAFLCWMLPTHHTLVLVSICNVAKPEGPILHWSQALTAGISLLKTICQDCIYVCSGSAPIDTVNN